VGGLDTVANATALLARIKAEGGTAVASNFFVYCGDKVEPNGTFSAGAADEACDAFISGARTMGMGGERVVGGDISGLRVLFNDTAKAHAAAAAIAELVRVKGLTGVSWDVEPQGTTWHDAVAFGKLNANIKAALPIGARVTTYSNGFSPIIADIDDYLGSVDAVLTGETYDGNSYDEWLGNYKKVAQCFTKSCTTSVARAVLGDAPSRVEGAAVVGAATWAPPSKMVPSMLASTERGDWNCEPAGMAERVARLLADNTTELGLFALEPAAGTRMGSRKGVSCIDAWFPYARAFINGSKPAP